MTFFRKDVQTYDPLTANPVLPNGTEIDVRPINTTPTEKKVKPVGRFAINIPGIVRVVIK
jgi:hypothetical protein